MVGGSHCNGGFAPLLEGKECAVCHEKGYKKACSISRVAIQVRCDLNLNWEIDSVNLYKSDSSEKHSGRGRRTC